MMQAENSTVEMLLPHLFRKEYAKLTAVLSRYFGLEHIEAAEDIASETFLKATEHWPVYGIPDTPAAWLYTVAKNKAKDYLKRHQLFESRIRAEVRPDETVHTQAFDFTEEIIADSQRRCYLRSATLPTRLRCRSVWPYRSCTVSVWRNCQCFSFQ